MKCKHCDDSFTQAYSWQVYCTKECSKKAGYLVRVNKGRRSDILKKFNITVEEYNTLLESQGGTCAICGEAETDLSSNRQSIKHLAVDHDHVTGKNRGLLCARCNKMLGLASDSPWIFAEASLYLLNHNTVSDRGKWILKKRLEDERLL